ncbi:hypothetical protein C8R46DRAFT_1286230 [Mycena filopes]|nr:hypothetical protein C8R46DRAFT_1286230 [Mycena filopes]
MSLAAAPQDVLLEVVKRLDLIGLFNILSVCRTFRELQWQKSLWLHALVRLREVEMQPLPLSNVKQLDSMSRQELQDVARRAVRLKKNLNSDKPTPVKTRTLSVEAYTGTSGICLLTGSNLLVTHSEGSVSCWDILTSRRVAHLEVVALRIMDEPWVEQDGKALFGARLQANQFAAVCIDYQDRGQISISHVASPPTDALSSHGRSGFFLNSDVMGFCTSASTIYWSMEKASEVRTGTTILPAVMRLSIFLPNSATLIDVILQIDSPPGRCLVLGSNIYILHHNVGTPEVRIERHPFPGAAEELVLATPSDQPKTWTPSVPYPFSDECLADAVSTVFHPTQVQVPGYGVYALESTVFGWGDAITSVVHFWSGRVVQGNMDVGAAAFYYATEGVVSMVAAGRSGSYILILVHQGAESGAYLGLVHVELSPRPHTTFRRLEFEGIPPLFSIAGLALDDSLGLVVVVDHAGNATTAFYV